MKVVVLGDGLLGTEIVKQTNWPCISRKKDGFDLKQPALYSLFKLHEYNVIVNCIANTNTYSNDREEHWNVNYKAVKDLAEFCNEHKIKLIHISTDYLYANNTVNTNPSEVDVPVHAENWYSYTKLLGDSIIQLISKDYLICRCTHKPTPWKYDTVWTGVIGNFDYVDVISNLIVKLILKDAKGVFNVGTEVKTLYDLAYQTNQSIGMSDKFKQPSTPSNTIMNVSKLNKFIK